MKKRKLCPMCETFGAGPCNECDALNKPIRRKGRKPITKQRMIAVLDRNFAEAGINITVRRYNKILTDLGFRLSNSKPAP